MSRPGRRQGWGIVLLLLPCWCFAGSVYGPGILLKIPSNARSMALGGAIASDSQGAEGIQHNPAGLIYQARPGVLFSYGKLFETVSYGAAAVSIPWGRFAAAGLQVTHLSQAPLDSYDVMGAPSGSVSPSDTGLQAGLAGKTFLGQFGVNLKYLRSDLGPASAGAFLSDAGWRQEFGRRVSAAAGVENAGTRFKYEHDPEDAPLSYYAGFTWRNYGRLPVKGMAETVVREGKVFGSGGIETSVVSHNVVSLKFRVGYSSEYPRAGGLSGWRTGFGLRLKNTRIDYALVPAGELGGAHWITLGYDFIRTEKP